MEEQSSDVAPFARTPEEWVSAFKTLGEPSFRGKQVFEWIHKHGVFDPLAMTNLPAALRQKLSEAGLGLPVAVSREAESSDGTRKFLVRMSDGREVETVLIPQLEHDPDVDEEDRDVDQGIGLRSSSTFTQCISTQVGCAMGCVFCASGVAGLSRHLTAAEIVGQVLLGRSLLRDGQRLRNIVLMGMGEPLHNYDEVARTLRLLTHPGGLGLSKRRVTLSTSGLVPQIDRLASDFEGQVQLAISLHAVSDEARSKIMPINQKYPLRELMACLRRYPLPRRRRITIEYTLIEGVNDSMSDADALVALLRGVSAKVNLIPLNPIAQSELKSPVWDAVDRFQERVHSHGVTATVRKRRGGDVDAACGQLALYDEHGEKLERKRRLPVER